MTLIAGAATGLATGVVTGKFSETHRRADGTTPTWVNALGGIVGITAAATTLSFANKAGSKSIPAGIFGLTAVIAAMSGAHAVTDGQ